MAVRMPVKIDSTLIIVNVEALAGRPLKKKRGNVSHTVASRAASEVQPMFTGR
jgi:hypothetical protein